MSFITALFGEVRAAFGIKGYLLAGLLPAFVAVFGWRWYISNLAARSNLEPLVGLSDTSLEGYAAEVIVLVFLGVAFYAARSLFVVAIQTLGFLPVRPREALIQRQLREHSLARHRKHHLELAYNAVRWIERDPNARRPTWIPGGYQGHDAARTVGLSRRARELFESMTPKISQPVEVPSRDCHAEIVRGMEALYGYMASHPKKVLFIVQPELNKWAIAVRRPGARGLLKYLSAALHREIAAEQETLNRLSEPEWMRPTALGTLASKLDDYGYQRYGIHTSAILSRLLGILSDKERAALSDSRLSVETLINLAVSVGGLGLACALHNAMDIVPRVLKGEAVRFDLRQAGFVFVPVALGWVFYRASLFAYGTHSEQVIRLVDLRRLHLIRALGFRVPHDVDEENWLWSEIVGAFEGTPPPGDRRIEFKPTD